MTPRQELILMSLVKDYIERGKPLSSLYLFNKLNKRFSPATIRNDLFFLTTRGYLEKDFFSAGRRPTDKAYRFFVNDIIKKIKILSAEKDLDISFSNNLFAFVREITKRLGYYTQLLTLSCLKEEGIVFKEGWEEMIKRPEFREEDFLRELKKFLQCFEKFYFQEDYPQLELKNHLIVYIGKEIPFGSFHRLGMVCAVFSLPFKRKMFISLVGPKRMNYPKAIIWTARFKNTIEKRYE